jgi:hypothetical protein
MTAIRDRVLDEHARQVMKEIGADCPPLAFGPIREMLAAIWQARGAVDLEAVETRLAQLTGWVASQPYREDGT